MSASSRPLVERVPGSPEVMIMSWSSAPVRARRDHRFRPHCTVLEGRLLLAAFPVVGADGGAPSSGRQVIFNADPSPMADLSLTSTAAPDYATVGENLTYAISVANNGPEPATGVTLIDTLPSGVNFLAATGGVTPAGNTLTFTLGTL